MYQFKDKKYCGHVLCWLTMALWCGCHVLSERAAPVLWTVLTILASVPIAQCNNNLDRETAASRLCRGDKSTSIIQCPVVPLSRFNVTVNGVVHACTLPIYIQFRIKLTNVTRVTEYTFINRDETQRIRNLGVNDVTLRVKLRHSDNFIFIKAGFLEPRFEEYFLETYLDIPDQDKCSNADTSAARVLPVALVAVAAVAVAAAAVGLLVWWYKRRQRAKLTASELLADMESSPTTLPYQEEAGDNKPASTTVIQNAVYRDSAVLEGDDRLDTITEEGGGGEGEELVTSPGGRGQRHRHRKRRSGRYQRPDGDQGTPDQIARIAPPPQIVVSPSNSCYGNGGHSNTSRAREGGQIT